MNININNDNNDYVRGCKDGKRAGIAAEHDRAQQLIDRLGIALENIYNIHSHLWSEFDRKEITSILEQWKSGKGKEVEEECTCSLTRIVTHGKCYKCPELTNQQK